MGGPPVMPPPPPPPPPGYGPSRSAPTTDGMAIAALVCGIVGFALCFVPSIVGLVLGFVSRSRIKRSNGTLTGGGMALAGIILGFVAIALIVLYVVFLVAVTVNSSDH